MARSCSLWPTDCSLASLCRTSIVTDLYAHKISLEARRCTRSSATTCLFITIINGAYHADIAKSVAGNAAAVYSWRIRAGRTLRIFRSAIQVLITFATTFDACSFTRVLNRA